LIQLAVILGRSPVEVSGGGSSPVVGSTESIGRLLFTDYLLPFEFISVLILIAILGAVVLTKREL
jgi:NADH-quinone oxidoreductase subunit J